MKYDINNKIVDTLKLIHYRHYIYPRMLEALMSRSRPTFSPREGRQNGGSLVWPKHRVVDYLLLIVLNTDSFMFIIHVIYSLMLHFFIVFVH